MTPAAMRAPAVALLLVPLAAAPASAHAPIEGIGEFYNGVLHPVLVPAHLLLLVGVALLLGQSAQDRRTGLWVLFVAAFPGAVALAALMKGVPEAALLACALATGAIVALNRPLPAWLAAALVAAGAILVGLDSVPDGATGTARWIAMTGTAVGGVVATTLVAGVAAAVRQNWQRIGVRIAGAWAAAAATIALALALSGPGAVS